MFQLPTYPTIPAEYPVTVGAPMPIPQYPLIPAPFPPSTIPISETILSPPIANLGFPFPGPLPAPFPAPLLAASLPLGSPLPSAPPVSTPGKLATDLLDAADGVMDGKYFGMRILQSDDTGSPQGAGFTNSMGTGLNALPPLPAAASPHTGLLGSPHFGTSFTGNATLLNSSSMLSSSSPFLPTTTTTPMAGEYITLSPLKITEGSSTINISNTGWEKALDELKKEVDHLKSEGGMSALRELLQMKVEELEKCRQSEMVKEKELHRLQDMYAEEIRKHTEDLAKVRKAEADIAMLRQAEADRLRQQQAEQERAAAEALARAEEAAKKPKKGKKKAKKAAGNKGPQTRIVKIIRH